ncbi:MAG: glutamate 5-kinase [Myxococcales bacterium]|nr:glutamate 5-kinase [Myxococcales bacterium]
MSDRARLRTARRVVIKIGSRLVAGDPVGLTGSVAAEVVRLRQRGIEALVVSSGAIAFGVKDLGLAERPRDLPRLQAAAAVGQSRLVLEWIRAFAAERITVGQVLLTHDDVRSRTRYLNARHTLSALLALRVVPVINENDTVSVDEIKFGDNDRLAALVCSLVDADLLVILTDVEGLHDADPHQGGRLIHEVNDIDREAAPVAGGSTSGIGTGGMASKVEAARIAVRFGVPTVVASGRRERPVTPILDGEEVGTVFWPTVSRLQSRKHWIAYALKPVGRLTVDEGARRALIEGGRSLLPSGITAVAGRFEAGEAVAISDGADREFARGLAAYSSDEIDRIRGRRTADLEELLGYRSLDEVIHRDDLVLL